MSTQMGPTMLMWNRSIRLDEHRAFGGDGILSTLASIPVAAAGAGAAAWGWVTRRVPYLDGLFGSHTPYRSIPIDDDAGESLCDAVAGDQALMSRRSAWEVR
jgi:hypothetical protein